MLLLLRSLLKLFAPNSPKNDHRLTATEWFSISAHQSHYADKAYFDAELADTLGQRHRAKELNLEAHSLKKASILTQQLGDAETESRLIAQSKV